MPAVTSIAMSIQDRDYYQRELEKKQRTTQPEPNAFSAHMRALTKASRKAQPREEYGIWEWALKAAVALLCMYGAYSLIQRVMSL